MGFVIFVAMGVYLLISIGVVAWAASHAKKNGKSAKHWGWGAVLVMYLIPFWDWIPTVATQQFYCAKDSGFWVYKTLDQWKAENPGVMEILVANKGAPSRYERFDGGHRETSTYLLNDRFNWIVIQQDISFLLPIIRVEQQVRDVKDGEVLARYVDFGSGNSVKNTVGPPGPLKFWLHSGHCSGGGNNQDALRNFRDSFIARAANSTSSKANSSRSIHLTSLRNAAFFIQPLTIASWVMVGASEALRFADTADLRMINLLFAPFGDFQL